MGLMHAGLLLLLFYSYQFRSQAGYSRALRDPDEEWRRLEVAIDEETSPELGLRSAPGKPLLASAVSFPAFLRVPRLKYPIVAFKPEKGARELPEFAKEILKVPSTHDFNNWQLVSSQTGTPARPKLVEMLCHIDRIYVRIRNEVFKTASGPKHVQLGKCSANARNMEYTYFLYRLTHDCGFIFESKSDYLLLKTVLQYKPSDNVIREIPFTIPLHCVYHRTFHSYKVGFYPKLRGGTVFKALQPKHSAILVPLDASGDEITDTKTYTLGQQMYFMVKNPNEISANRRMYINKCFMTPNQNLGSSMKHEVINNQGCLVDSKEVMQSKFLPSPSKLVQKFTVAAFVFKDMISTSSSKKLYMHCEVLVGKLTPTPSSKACTYDIKMQTWKELYGHDSVCSCCETSCPSIQPKASRKTISSPSWRVDLSKDGYVDVEPLKSEGDSWEDPDFVEESDFVNYWEHDD